MTVRVAHLRAAAAALALLAPAAPAAAAWTQGQWLTLPSEDAEARPGPLALGPAGAVTALLRGDPGAGGIWLTVRHAPGAGWTDPAPEGDPPAGLTPVAATASGDLLATGVVTTPSGAVVTAARRRGGVWEAPRPLSGPLADVAGAGVTGVIAADGTAAVGWREGPLVRVTALDGDRVDVLAGPGDSAPVLRTGESGDVLAVWTRMARGGDELVSATRAAGAGWAPVRRLPTPRLPAGGVQWDAGVSANGTAVLAWTAGARGRHRVWWSLAARPGGGWSTSSAIGGPVPGARVEAVRVDAAGDAVAVWSTTLGTASATRPAGAAGWTADGTVRGAPGRGRAATAPIQVSGAPLGGVHIAWAVRAGVAVSSRDAHVPAPWPAASIAPAPPGPLAWRFSAGDAALAVLYAVRSGVGSGRVGADVAEAAAAARVTAVRAARGRAGVRVVVTLSGPGRVALDVLAAGAARPLATALADLPPGATPLDLPALATDLLQPGRTYVVRARTAASAATSGPVRLRR